MIRVEKVTSNPNFEDTDILVFDDFFTLLKEVNGFPDSNESELLDEMAHELNQLVAIEGICALMDDYPDILPAEELTVYRHIGNDTVITMTWSAD